MSLLLLLGGCQAKTYTSSNAEDVKEMKKWFKWATGCDLPSDSTILMARDTNAYGSVIWMKIQAGPELIKLLQTKGKPATKSDIAAAMTPTESERQWIPFWQGDKVKNPTCYELKVKDTGGGGFETRIFIEESGTTVWLQTTEWL